MKTIKLTLMALCVLSLTCCTSAKQALVSNNNEVEIEQLCHYTTDENNFYANASAVSTDMQMAKDKAISAARVEIANTMSIVVENFVKRYRKDVNDQLDQKTEDRLQTITKETLSGSTVICDRLTRTADGKYRSYISVKLPKKEVKDSIEKVLRENNVLKLETDQTNFDKIADAEIAKAGL